jgi:DNA modification methylase
MDIEAQLIEDRYAVFNGDCMDAMAPFPDGCVHLSVYSPPFAGLYQYSSDPNDLSNCLNREEFFQHYEFVVREVHRLTMPGRMSAVHCMDIPTGNTGLDHLSDLPGDIIRLHEKCGFKYVARYHVWKEPLTVRNRTMTKSLSHKGVTIDSTRCSIANADYLLIFRRSGQNPIPVAHPEGLTVYSGARRMPNDVLAYKDWKGPQLENRYSHWIWRNYASAFWDDVRLDRVLPFKPARDTDDERHVHPLQLDVIDRALVLWSNPDETILTPFMGVGSEVYSALKLGRRAIGIELKPSYYRQALKNIAVAMQPKLDRQDELEFAGEPDPDEVEPDEREAA